MRPRCLICGDPLQVTLEPHQSDAYVAVRGRWLWVPEMNASVFMLDPKSDMTVISIDDQLALITDTGNRSTLHIHTECQEALVKEDLSPPICWDENDLIVQEVH